MKLISILLHRSVLPILACALFLLTQPASARQDGKKKFRGTVTTQENEPVIGATVTVKGGAGTMTDVSGNFTIEAEEGAAAIISSIGFENKALVLKGDGPVAVKLDKSYRNLNDVIVVGYGSVKKKTSPAP